MSAWEKWKRRPQNVWLRKALFQVHLWTGIGLGLYVLLMSVTGSALVFRREMVKSLAREPSVVPVQGARMAEDNLKLVAKRAYPDYEVTRVWQRKNPDQAVEIWMERRGKRLQRLFNPYTGADLGDSLRFGFRLVLWLADLHDNNELVVPVGSVLPLSEVRAAHEMLAGTRAHKRGKIVLQVAG